MCWRHPALQLIPNRLPRSRRQLHKHPGSLPPSMWAGPQAGIGAGRGLHDVAWAALVCVVRAQPSS